MSTWLDSQVGDSTEKWLARVRTFADIPEQLDEESDPAALFRGGWLRRGHFALLVAQSGLGKSVIATQAALSWSIGKRGLFGEAIRPLRVGLIQSEDDDYDMALFRSGHRLGFAAEGWSQEEIGEAERAIFDLSGIFAASRGKDFCSRLDRTLEMMEKQGTRLDVVILNPLQAYTGFDLASNADLSEFLRSDLDPILKKRGVALLAVHHTNKPAFAQGRDKPEDDLSAYVGAGGAELVNYSRAIMSIRRATSKESLEPHAYALLGSKRGMRLGWQDANGAPTTKKLIAYSHGYTHWRELEAKPTELAEKVVSLQEDAMDLAKYCARENRPLCAGEVRVFARRLYGNQRRGDCAFSELAGKPETYGVEVKTAGVKKTFSFHISQVR